MSYEKERQQTVLTLEKAASDQGLHSLHYFIWAAARQNQQYGRCAHRRLRSARASAQSDQSSLFLQWEARNLMLLHADSDVSDQTGRVSKLIHVFAGRTCNFVDCVMLRHNWLANSAKIKLKKSSLMIIILPLIIFCCYHVTAYYFTQAWSIHLLC